MKIFRLYFQDIVTLFNAEGNPSGTFVSSPEYRLILVVAMVVAVTVAVKRFWLGLFLGRQTFGRFLLCENYLGQSIYRTLTNPIVSEVRYADDLAKAMQKALLIGNVAALARDIEQQTFSKKDFQLDTSRYAEMEENSVDKDKPTPDEDASVTGKSNADNVMEGIRINSEQKVRIDELLGAWEEPEIVNKKDVRHYSCSGST